ncbi:general secretion pathway protein GspK [Alkalisalibacterium limincola]|uniref:general secretion pathway protein GspK n=1 Tax=Alkalisalibacterium limincola TaxID=2699169 RepID=UPI0021063F74|nr:type II secretion system protein GspK [Alkalisalibacterium limincola]
MCSSWLAGVRRHEAAGPAAGCGARGGLARRRPGRGVGRGPAGTGRTTAGAPARQPALGTELAIDGGPGSVGGGHAGGRGPRSGHAGRSLAAGDAADRRARGTHQRPATRPRRVLRPQFAGASRGGRSASHRGAAAGARGPGSRPLHRRGSRGLDRPRPRAATRGREDGAYMGRMPGWRTGNRPMAHASEVRRLARVDARAWERLESYVCALPASAPINLNTAPPLLWLALDPRIDEAMARRLARSIDSAYPSLEAVAQALEREGLAGVDLGQAGLQTRFYMAEGWIESEGVRYVHSSLVERDRGLARVRVLARARGEL